MTTASMVGETGRLVHGLLGRRSVASELRALAAMARKDWAIFRRYPGRLANIFIWPVLFPLGVHPLGAGAGRAGRVEPAPLRRRRGRQRLRGLPGDQQHVLQVAELALFAVALPLLGFLAFRSTERRSCRTGSLGHY